MIRVRVLSVGEARDAAPALAAILHDCIEGGASVSFLAETPLERLIAFWANAADAGDGRAIIVAEDEAGLAGVVQVIPSGIENQPHRAEIAKMLVARRARRRGAGEALMRAAEDAARAMGKTLLTLDTVTGAAGERLYARLGWQFVGVIPDYALLPDGGYCSTSIFYKVLPPFPEADA